MKIRKRLNVGDQTRIVYHPKSGETERVFVTILVSFQGRGLVGVDKQGRLYTTWWDQQTETAKRLTVFSRHWRRFDKGLYYLKRCLVYALLETTKIKIPAIEELQHFCQKTRSELSLLEGDITDQLEKIGQSCADLTEFLNGRRRPRLKRSKQQLQFFLLLRDTKGRINIGVLQARLTVIDDQFCQELTHLLGWTPHYAARLTAIHGMQKGFEANVARVRQSLTAMLNHRAFKVNETTAKQVAGISQALKNQIGILQSLAGIRPFNRWAEHCLDDLKEASRLITRHDFAGAKKILDRTVEAIQIRLIGFEIEELISHLSLALLWRQVEKKYYLDKIGRLLNRLAKLDDSGFSQPVIRPVRLYLAQASAAGRRNDWQRAKRLLKQAVAPI